MVEKNTSIPVLSVQIHGVFTTQKALFLADPKSKALYANDSWLSTQKRIRMSDINRLLGLRPYPGKPAGAVAFGNPQSKHHRFQKPKVMGNYHVMMWGCPHDLGNKKDAAKNRSSNGDLTI